MNFKTLFPEIDWATTDSICLGRDRELTASSVASAIVSFSNGKGGVLALGVSSSGEPDGLDLNSLEEAKRSLLSLLENRLSGEVRYRFILRSLDDWAEEYVLVMEVMPSPAPIHVLGERLEPMEDRRERLTPLEETVHAQKLKEFSRVEFDLAKWSGLVKEGLKTNPDLKSHLVSAFATKGFVHEGGFANNGLLLFKDLSHEAGAAISCHLFDDFKKRELKRNELRGAFLENLDAALDFLEGNLSCGKKADPSSSMQSRSAFRAALLFSFIHKDYQTENKPITVNIWGGTAEIAAFGKAFELSDDGEVVKEILQTAGILGQENLPAEVFLDWKKAKASGGAVFKASEEGFAFEFGVSSSEEDKKLPGRPFKGDLAVGREKILASLENGPKSVKELQKLTPFTSRAYFLKKLVGPLVQEGAIEKVGDRYSPTSYYRLKRD